MRMENLTWQADFFMNTEHLYFGPWRKKIESTYYLIEVLRRPEPTEADRRSGAHSPRSYDG